MYIISIFKNNITQVQKSQVKYRLFISIMDKSIIALFRDFHPKRWLDNIEPKNANSKTKGIGNYSKKK